MSDFASDPDRLIGAVTQLQILHRQGRFAVPLRAKWLPTTLRGTAMPRDVSDVFAHLQPLLKTNLNRISRGAELPPDTAEHLHRFYRSLVLLRLSPEPAKADRAEELLEALAEELDAVEASDPAGCAGDFRDDRQRPGWLTLYRVLAPSSNEQWEQAREIAHYLARCDAEVPPADTNTLALLTWLARVGDQPARRLLLGWVRSGLDYPQRWNWLRSDAVRDYLADRYADDERREFVNAAIEFLLTHQRLAERRCRLLESWFVELDEPAELLGVIRGLVRLERQAGGLHERTIDALETRGPRAAPNIVGCLLFEEDMVASPDAQFLIGELLCAHDIAAQAAFRSFCRRIAGVELTVGLKTELTERVLNNTKLKQAMIGRGWSSEKLVGSLRAGTDTRRQLFYLLLLALQEFDAEPLAEVTRALSLIDVAIRQTKIDGRHLTLLLSDVLSDPREGLWTLIDEERIDKKSAKSRELSLLYWNLRLISQTSDRIESVDLEDLSRTLRKLKIRDARGRDA